MSGKTKLGNEKYKKIAGEVEACNAEERLNMSAEERRTKLLSETEDVAREDQIFLRDGVEMASAMENVRFSLMDNAQAASEVAPYLNAFKDNHITFNGLVNKVKDVVEKYPNAT